MKLKKETVTKTYRSSDTLVEIIKQYNYSSEEEKMQHNEFMENNVYKDSGQVKENIGTFNKPEYVWFGSYYKCYELL